jgi:hypothetical protein
LSPAPRAGAQRSLNQLSSGLEAVVPALFALDVATAPAAWRVVLRLADGEGRPLASHEVNLAAHPPARRAAAFETTGPRATHGAQRVPREPARRSRRLPGSACAWGGHRRPVGRLLAWLRENYANPAKLAHGLRPREPSALLRTRSAHRGALRRSARRAQLRPRGDGRAGHREDVSRRADRGTPRRARAYGGRLGEREGDHGADP